MIFIPFQSRITTVKRRQQSIWFTAVRLVQPPLHWAKAPQKMRFENRKAQTAENLSPYSPQDESSGCALKKTPTATIATGMVSHHAPAS